jgi:hypothetical protein
MMMMQTMWQLLLLCCAILRGVLDVIVVVAASRTNRAPLSLSTLSSEYVSLWGCESVTIGRQMVSEYITDNAAAQTLIGFIDLFCCPQS